MIVEGFQMLLGRELESSMLWILLYFAVLVWK